MIEAAVAILRIPPKITMPVNTVKTIPVYIGSMPKLLCTACATELDCTELPIPKEATVPKKAKAIANHFHFEPKPRSI